MRGESIGAGTNWLNFKNALNGSKRPWNVKTKKFGYWDSFEMAENYNFQVKLQGCAVA